MRRAPQQPTLLIFTLGPHRESGRRRLLPGRWRTLEDSLHRRGLEAALAAGRACGCRIEVAAPRRLDLPEDVLQAPQRGRGFAARLRSAVAAARSRSTGPLLVVGTDCPDLSAAHLADALERLRRDPGGVVLGPARDGGFYLLAADGPLDDELAEVRWCRSDTLATLLAALRRRGRRADLLEPLRDLDRTADLELWLARGGPAARPWRELRRRLLALFARLRRPLPLSGPARPLPARVRTAPGRAPPA